MHKKYLKFLIRYAISFSIFILIIMLIYLVIYKIYNPYLNLEGGRFYLSVILISIESVVLSIPDIFLGNFFFNHLYPKYNLDEIRYIFVILNVIIYALMGFVWGLIVIFIREKVYHRSVFSAKDVRSGL